MSNGEEDGYYLNAKTWGTYIHGIFDNRSVVRHIMRQIDANFDVTINYAALKEKGYDDLAQMIRDNVDVSFIYKSMRR